MWLTLAALLYMPSCMCTVRFEGNRFCHVCARSQCYLSILQACLSETMDMIGQFAFGAQLNAIQ